ncbi:MAG: hypothetical protein K2Q06_05925, partial [Parvularculaceae bacterium]|nr:hypothetical protein [Parvularculaceae bacterium]
RLFGDYLGHATTAVLNLDNAETRALAAASPGAMSFGVDTGDARFVARAVSPEPWGVSFAVVDKAAGETAQVSLKTPGRHNVSNALAAIAAARAIGVSLREAADALGRFEGVRRRLEIAGQAGGVVVIDDFAHNPDKIAATLRTLREHDGRILALFQPHGFGPLKLMGAEIADAFAENLRADDYLAVPEPVYYGGTTDRAVSSADIVSKLRAKGVRAEAFATREAAFAPLVERARPGDRIVVMGARDDTLSQFATDLVAAIGARLG